MASSGAVMGLVLSVGGWLGFGIAAAALLLWRHALATRAETVARACHELRGPLAAARLGLELSVARPAGSMARLRAIELELDRAAIALDDLQGVTRAGAEPPLVDVESWLTASVEASRPVAARHGATVRLRWEGPPARVRGERARLAQATGNLIANAIEHAGGLVEVTGRVKDGRVLVEVRDAGPGLRPELRTWLEREGSRRFASSGLPGASRSSAGRGRGLVIARTVAAAQGGRLMAPPSDHGARLVLELPLAGADGGGPNAIV